VRKWDGGVTSVVLAGGLFAQGFVVPEGSSVWRVVISALVACGLGYGLVAIIQRVRGGAGRSPSPESTVPAPTGRPSLRATDLNLAERVVTFRRFAGLREKGLLTEAELAAAKAHLFPGIAALAGEQQEPESGGDASSSHGNDAADADDAVDADDAADDEETPPEGVFDSVGAGWAGTVSVRTWPWIAVGVVAVLTGVAVAAGVLGGGGSEDDAVATCSDSWPISQRQCELIIDASNKCPADKRNDFRLLAQIAFGSGDLGLNAAIDSATSIFCADPDAAEVVTTTSRRPTTTTGAPTITAAPTTITWLSYPTTAPTTSTVFQYPTTAPSTTP